MSDSKQTSNIIPWIVSIIIVLISALLLFNFFKNDNTPTSTENSQAKNTINNSTANTDDQLSLEQTSLLSQQADNTDPVTDNRFKTGEENLPRSLSGTTVDGSIIIDENNRLVPTRELRRLYDYFLSALGEESSETIDARVEAYISSRTPEPAASTAIALYYTYKEYLHRVSTIHENYGDLQLRQTQVGEIDLNLMQQSQQDISKIRNELFDAETITAFFGGDDELQDYNLAMMEISQNPNLTDAQRQQAVQEYQNRLPDSLMKDRLIEKQKFDNLVERTKTLEAQGASDAELFNMRAETVGVEAAHRLAEIDSKNKNFDQRFERYQSAKAQIIATTDELQRETLISNLEDELFSEAEQKRLKGYAAFKEYEQSQ